jgi:hypothetical protein
VRTSDVGAAGAESFFYLQALSYFSFSAFLPPGFGISYCRFSLQCILPPGMSPTALFLRHVGSPVNPECKKGAFCGMPACQAAAGRVSLAELCNLRLLSNYIVFSLPSN